MHTNETPNYHLPQFVGTDIINPLVDTNSAYSTIDTALKDISDNEVTDAGKILALETTVGNSSAGLVKDVANLQSKNGDSVLTTDAQTLSAAINEVDSHTDTNTGNIADNALAITGLQNTVGNANSGLVKDVADIKTVTDDTKLVIVSLGQQSGGSFDGTKTIGEVLKTALDALIATYGTAAYNGYVMKLTFALISGFGNFIFAPIIVNCGETLTSFANNGDAYMNYGSGTQFRSYYLHVDANNAVTIKQFYFDGSTNTSSIYDSETSTPASGSANVRFELYKKVNQ